MTTPKSLLTILLIFAFCFSSASARSVESFADASTVVLASEKFVRTELYFGLTKPDGTMLSDAEWSAFVDDVITPRFPDGFTVVDGKGQWRNKSGKIAKEQSKVFIVFYPKKVREAAGKKIDEIRSQYSTKFEQESVLRADSVTPFNLSF